MLTDTIRQVAPTGLAHRWWGLASARVGSNFANEQLAHEADAMADAGGRLFGADDGPLHVHYERSVQ